MSAMDGTFLGMITNPCRPARHSQPELPWLMTGYYFLLITLHRACRVRMNFHLLIIYILLTTWRLNSGAYPPNRSISAISATETG